MQVNVASPAYPRPIRFTQPDGKTLTITLKGDEHTKWATTADGYTLMSDPKGYYEYATTDSRGFLTLSGVIAKNVESRTAEDQKILTNLSKGLSYSKEQLQMLRSIRAIKRSEAKKAFPTTGNRKLVCILMGFKDKAFTKTLADFNNLFNQVNYTTDGATGSVKDYYLENSYNKFNLDVTVAGPYTAANNMAYYGANDANDNDVKPDALVTEAVTAADATVNFANFDNDNDGNVDGVYVIYAGYGEEAGASTDAIWAHAWEIPAKTLDGKVVSSYSCSAELANNSGTTMTAIGVICHEFGHVLGAPDYYDVDYDTNGQYEGTGDWDLMSGGSWNNNGVTPANHNAYTKVYVYGWSNATTLAEGATITIPSSKTDQNAFYRVNTTTADEFFLIENRQKTGFDAALPGHGLLIYHVHKDILAHFSSNDINAQAPQMMYPVCASTTTEPSSNGTSYGSINAGGCPFPGTSSKTQFTDITTPSAKSWAGANTNKPITNISENTSTGVITFDFDGGNTGNPKAFTATPVSTSQIDLTWAKTDNNDVVLAYSLTPTFGSLVDGTTYTPSQEIAGGGTILAVGDATSFSHSALGGNKTYYYKVWSKLSSTPIYSPGIAVQATTMPGDPIGFSATAISTSQIDLAWTKTENKDIVVAFSTTPTFGSLVDGTTYTQGQEITGGGTVLVSGDATSFSHTGLTGSQIYYYKAWSKLSLTPSYSPGTVSQAKTLCSGSVALPLTEDFNTASLPGCWSNNDNNGNGQIWQFGTFTNGLSGIHAYLDSDGYGEGNSQNADLITPTINLNGANSVTISFNHFFEFFDAEAATLSYSTDNGGTWIQLDKWTASTSNPQVYKKVITGITQYTIMLKWNYTGAYGYFWCIDDISVVETSAEYSLSISKVGNGTVAPTVGAHTYNSGTTVTLTATPDQGWKFDKWEINGNRVLISATDVTITANTTAIATFSLLNSVVDVTSLLKVYPNPVVSTINIESAGIIKSISVMDLTGRILIQNEGIAKTTSTVDCSELPSGIYLLRVDNLGNSSQVVRIVKR